MSLSSFATRSSTSIWLSLHNATGTEFVGIDNYTKMVTLAKPAKPSPTTTSSGSSVAPSLVTAARPRLRRTHRTGPPRVGAQTHPVHADGRSRSCPPVYLPPRLRREPGTGCVERGHRHRARRSRRRRSTTAPRPVGRHRHVTDRRRWLPDHRDRHTPAPPVLLPMLGLPAERVPTDAVTAVTAGRRTGTTRRRLARLHPRRRWFHPRRRRPHRQACRR